MPNQPNTISPEEEMQVIVDPSALSFYFKAIIPEVSDTTRQRMVSAIEAGFEDYIAKRDAYVIGEIVKPTINGKVPKRGETVTIDLENNQNESLKFIQENGAFRQQDETIKRAKQWDEGELSLTTNKEEK